MKLVVVIVNYRTAGLTVDCLRTLAAEMPVDGGVRVIITDNASGDDSVERLRSAIAQNEWGWAEVMPLARNGGFAYGNNEGIRAAMAWPDRPEYVWLLNPDTLVKPGAVSGLVNFLDQRPKVGIVGSRIEGADGQPHSSAFTFPSPLGELENALRLGIASRLLARWVVARGSPKEACAADWVSGASTCVRREVLEQVGLLDEGFFMYFEEVDLCLRAQRAGWGVWYTPDSRIVHLAGQASGIGDPTRPARRRPGYWFDSRRRYFLKNRGKLGAMLSDLMWGIGFASWRLRRRVQGKPDEDPPQLLGDFWRNSVFVKGMKLEQSQ